MADPRMKSALEGIAVPGRHGRRSGTAGVTAAEVKGFGLASIGARAGAADALRAAVRQSFDLDPPSVPRKVDGPGLSMIWTGPDQWLAFAPVCPADGMERFLGPALGAHAAIADQSHARLLLRMSGPRLRDALAKGIAIDLHPRAFGPGDTAATQAAHIGVQLWQVDAVPTYEMAAFRGFAGSLWGWFADSAAEYGLDFLG